MIYICAGLPKSASTICFEYVKSSLLSYNKNVLDFGFVYKFGIIKSIIILMVNSWNKNIIIKTHSPPNFFIKTIINIGLAKAIYTIRDPRDIILSSIDFKPVHSKQKIFLKYTSVENTIDDVSQYINRFEKWKNYGKVLFINYENVVQDPLLAIKKINAYFLITLPESKINLIIEEFKNNHIQNFNKAIINRYKNEMSNTELQFCNDTLKNEILSLGYSI
jgi:hypothetical protein